MFNKFVKIVWLSFIFLFINIKILYAYKCKYPGNFLLTKQEVEISDPRFECWEIRYLKEYENNIDMDFDAYLSLFPKEYSATNITNLREIGITPEKIKYLEDYFIDKKDFNEKNDFKKVIENAIYRAGQVIQTPVYYGRPLFFLNNPFHFSLDDSVKATASGYSTLWSLVTSPIRLVLDQFKGKTFYKPLLYVIGFNCLNFNLLEWDVGKQWIKGGFPDALKPVAVVGRYVVNAFAEVVGVIREKELKTTAEKINNAFWGGDNILTFLGNDKEIAKWNTTNCPIYEIEKTVAKSSSCLSCQMFEIAFNVVSRIGYILYDKIARYAINLMIVLFSLWSLFLFFELVIKKQDPAGYTKTFFTKIMWVFIISVFLSVSINDKNNILNYILKPITNFMFEYNDYVSSIIDNKQQYQSNKIDNKPKWECQYRKAQEKQVSVDDSNLLFSKDVRNNIICTLERIGTLNNSYIIFGGYQMRIAVDELLNLYFKNAFFRFVLGLIIVGLFVVYNLTISFFFIESLFKIAIVLFIAPLLIMGYAFDKGKQFAKQGLDTFLAAVFQMVSLSLMSVVIALIMGFTSNLDMAGLKMAMEQNDLQAVSSHLLLMFSFNASTFWEMLGMGIMSFVLMGEAMTIANKFSGYAKTETLPNTFRKFTKSIIKTGVGVAANKTGWFSTKADKTTKKIDNLVNKELKTMGVLKK